MTNDRKNSFKEKKEKLLAKRDRNTKDRQSINKLLVTFGAITVLASGHTVEAQQSKSQSSSKDETKTTMIETANQTSIFDKQLDEMTADYDAMMKKMEAEFNNESKEQEKTNSNETQKPERKTTSMSMRGGLIEKIQNQDGNNIEFKKDAENDQQSRNVLDQIIRGKMNADKKYAQSWVMHDVAQMVQDLNNNPAEFDKAVNRQMKGISSRVEKDGSVTFLYSKDELRYKVANFSKEVSENNPAIKRIRTNEAINQKNMEQTRSGK